MLHILAFVSWFCAVMAIRAFLLDLQQAARQREIDLASQRCRQLLPPIRVAGTAYRWQRWANQ